MSNIGPVFRHLRKSKGMTLKETADGLISSQFLSEFERGHSNISVVNFFSLLDKINVQITEFKIHSDELTEQTQQHFLSQYGKAYRSRNVVKLNELIDSQNKLYRNSKLPRFEHNVIILKQLINYFTNLPFNQTDANSIYHYLLNCEEWHYYELCLFGNSIFFMSLAQVEKLTRTASQKAHKYEKLLLNSSTFALVIMNVIDYFLEANYLAPVASLIKEVDRVLINKRYFYDKNQLNYLKGIYKIKMEMLEEGKDLCDEAIRLMSHFGAEDIANILQTELNEMLGKLE
ncbi:helix-turn-helix domain-containing protein [Fundicoccus ignavus]|uniref:Helix-turn-helix domain-containing protein n=1 Tax=Fundicoccus ignavus TaxID=2664442 RepID=A0A844C600_9LACT|nr:Rgg/GadR/MutR family transcriptional regulator [Fundicoccus ignavus]MRJ46073.1 helix-turn-helix domain-containing protein [Fundicoccus ignavus]